MLDILVFLTRGTVVTGTPVSNVLDPYGVIQETETLVPKIIGIKMVVEIRLSDMLEELISKELHLMMV
jgi:hypothetical protein